VTYELRDALADQIALQVQSYGRDPRDLDENERMEWVRWNVLALEDELHEALQETGWKPWATSNHLNRDAFRGELVDAFHFFLNLMAVADIPADELLASYRKKREKNARRQALGYDGVSEKCSECKRALDDDAVLCVKSEGPNGVQFWCERTKVWTAAGV
jgi:hypothetical protein